MSRGRRGVALLLLLGVLLAWLLGARTGGERALFLAAAHRGAPAAAALVPLTRLGNFVLLGPISLLLALVLARRRGAAVACLYLAATLAGRLAEDALKFAIARPRPSLMPHLDRVWESSFPSAHSFNATLVFVGFALVWGDRRLVAVAAALAAAIGASRVMLAVHWPSDVLGGWCLGGLGALLLAGLARGCGINRHIRRAS